MLIAIKESDRVVLGYLCDEPNVFFLPTDLTDPENVPLTFSKSGRAVAFFRANAVADLFLHEDGFINEACDPDNTVRSIPDIQEVLNECKFPKPQDVKWRNDLLICDDRHIYHLDCYFGFRELPDYACIDTNYDLESTVTTLLDMTAGLPAEERFRMAAKFLFSVHSVYRYPVIITDTKTRVLKALYKEGAEYERIADL